MLDSSGSAELSPQHRGWGRSLPNAAFAIESVPSDAFVAFLSFSDKVVHQSNGFEQVRQVREKIRDLANQTPQGHTALFDSISDGLSLFREKQFGNAIYLITDGRDNKSKLSAAKIREDLIAAGVRVFFFLPRMHDITSEEARG